MGPLNFRVSFGSFGSWFVTGIRGITDRNNLLVLGISLASRLGSMAETQMPREPGALEETPRVRWIHFLCGPLLVLWEESNEMEASSGIFTQEDAHVRVSCNKATQLQDIDSAHGTSVAFPVLGVRLAEAPGV